jgi:DNA-binding CsgD family transcriptional regulator
MNISELFKIISNIANEFSDEKKVAEDINDSELGGLVNEFSKNESSLKVIMDITKFQLLDVSDNLEEIFGITKEEFYDEKIFIFLRYIRSEHVLAPVALLKWGNHVFKEQVGSTPFKDLKMVACGINIKSKNGKEMRVLIRIKPIKVADNGYPNICIITYDDITNLLKPNTQWWARVCYGEDFPAKYRYLSTDKKSENEDIITDREKEVLKFISQGLESKDIGKKLFISSHTVDNHRRNAVQRTGARDTTALVQICRMCGMF